MISSDAPNVGEGVPPEILFLERCIQLLEPKGRLAIVIARGVLDNTNNLVRATVSSDSHAPPRGRKLSP